MFAQSASWPVIKLITILCMVSEQVVLITLCACTVVVKVLLDDCAQVLDPINPRDNCRYAAAKVIVPG